MSVGRSGRWFGAALVGLASAAVLGVVLPGVALAAPRPPAELAREARAMQGIGAYARAAEALRAVRGAVAPDGDLEMMLALFEARSGQLDSAAARLAGPLLSRVARDSLPTKRRAEYPWDQGEQWLDGKYGGWHWYVWRGRAEVAARRGRWADALAAAREAVAARPTSGNDWHLFALCAARTGAEAEAASAAARAVALDPTLPEARYLQGLLAWRAGRGHEASARFREAVALDSSYREAAMALVRSRLPGSRPDSLPAEPLSGIRRATLLASPVQPKIEEFSQVDISASLEHRVDPVFDIVPADGRQPRTMHASLLIDTDGRVAANDLPWFTESQVPIEALTKLLAPLPEWRFTPAMRNGQPEPVWLTVPFQIP